MAVEHNPEWEEAFQDYLRSRTRPRITEEQFRTPLAFDIDLFDGVQIGYALRRALSEIQNEYAQIAIADILLRLTEAMEGVLGDDQT